MSINYRGNYEFLQSVPNNDESLTVFNLSPIPRNRFRSCSQIYFELSTSPGAFMKPPASTPWLRISVLRGVLSVVPNDISLDRSYRFFIRVIAKKTSSPLEKGAVLSTLPLRLNVGCTGQAQATYSDYFITQVRLNASQTVTYKFEPPMIDPDFCKIVRNMLIFDKD